MIKNVIDQLKLTSWPASELASNAAQDLAEKAEAYTTQLDFIAKEYSREAQPKHRQAARDALQKTLDTYRTRIASMQKAAQPVMKQSGLSPEDMREIRTYLVPSLMLPGGRTIDSVKLVAEMNNEPLLHALLASPVSILTESDKAKIVAKLGKPGDADAQRDATLLSGLVSTVERALGADSIQFAMSQA